MTIASQAFHGRKIPLGRRQDVRKQRGRERLGEGADPKAGVLADRLAAGGLHSEPPGQHRRVVLDNSHAQSRKVIRLHDARYVAFELGHIHLWLKFSA